MSRKKVYWGAPPHRMPVTTRKPSFKLRDSKLNLRFPPSAEETAVRCNGPIKSYETKRMQTKSGVYYIPWEPITFIFRGEQTHIFGGVKPSFFMGFGVQGYTLFKYIYILICMYPHLFQPSTQSVTHRVHVWYIYLYLPTKSQLNIG